MKILTASAMRWAEQAAVDAGESFEGLMEKAGQEAAGILMEEAPPQDSPVLILCGKGTAWLSPGRWRKRDFPSKSYSCWGGN